MWVLDELRSYSTESTKNENLIQVKNPVLAQNQYSEHVSINWTHEHLVLLAGVQRLSNCGVKMANESNLGLQMLWAYPAPTQNCKAI